MKGITVKLPGATLRWLRQEARTTGRSVAALIRERLEAVQGAVAPSMRSPLILPAVWQAAESLQPTTGAGRAFVITICDTGPLVAYLNRNDPYHSWAVTLMKQARSAMLTTEPVLTEVAYFLRADRVDVDSPFRLKATVPCGRIYGKLRSASSPREAPHLRRALTLGR